MRPKVLPKTPGFPKSSDKDKDKAIEDNVQGLGTSCLCVYPLTLYAHRP